MKRNDTSAVALISGYCSLRAADEQG